MRPFTLELGPGAYRNSTAWRTRAHWLTIVLPAAVRERGDVLRRHHIAPGTFIAVMAAHAQHADDDTGRNAIPTVEHIQLLARCSERTVQRARAAARELGIGTEVFRGRHLTLVERLAAHQAGRTLRGWASVYALGCPRWLVKRLPGYRISSALSVDRGVDDGTPPAGRSFTRNRSLYVNRSSPLRVDERAPRTARKRPTQPKIISRSPWRPEALELARQLQRVIRTFAGVHPGRLAPVLTRFAIAEKPWTATQLRDAIERAQRAQRRDWISQPTAPHAYLAWLVRDIESTDNYLGAVEEAERINRRVAELAELRGENLCRHGAGGADPQTGQSARCAFCRRQGSLPASNTD